MTLKQEQILGVQVEICRALIWHATQYGEPVPFAALADSDKSLDVTAMRRLLKDGYVERERIKNFHGVGSRPGYVITDSGRAWYTEAKEIHNKLTKQPIR